MIYASASRQITAERLTNLFQTPEGCADAAGGVFGSLAVVVGIGEVAPGLAENLILHTAPRVPSEELSAVLRSWIAGNAILEGLP